MAIDVERRLWKVDEYERMVELGLLREDDRLELVEGEIIRMGPIVSAHAACVDRLTRVFSRTVGDAAIVRVQSPIRLGPDSEPQPDLVLLVPRPDFYAEAHPTAEAVLLIVEVADTSRDYDRLKKIPLYARVQIPEVWLVDLADAAVYIYTEPRGNAYRNVRQVVAGEAVDSQAVPGLKFPYESIAG